MENRRTAIRRAPESVPTGRKRVPKELRARVVAALMSGECSAAALIAFLTAPDSIRRILEHLGLPTRPPPIRYAPATLFELG